MLVAVAVLFAAALHASWNAIIKPSSDRAALLAAMCAASVAICLPAALLAAAPHSAAWPELAASAVIHVAYELLLIATYRDGDFGQVYPIARVTAPPTVALGAALIVGERLGVAQLAGLAIVSGGLFALAGGRHHSRRTLGLALLTGLTIAAYTVVDGVGVRHSGSPLGYTAWLFSASGTLVMLALVRPAVARARGCALRSPGGPARLPGRSRSAPAASCCGRRLGSRWLSSACARRVSRGPR